jgi:hypothetical protein
MVATPIGARATTIAIDKNCSYRAESTIAMLFPKSGAAVTPKEVAWN